MRLRILFVSVVALLALPAIGLAVPPTQAQATAVKACNALKVSLGESTFKASYGTNADKSNAFGKCVSRFATTATTAQVNAAKACDAEQADAGFAAAHGGKTFAQFYGKNDNDKNAYGKCVSAKAKAHVAQVVAAHVNAAKACKAERASAGFAAAHGGKTFAQFYGTNANDKNAFGKCVSAKAKA